MIRTSDVKLVVENSSEIRKGKGEAMKNEIQVFKNTEFGELKIIEVNGKPYFPATKCAEVLGYSNPQKAIRDHCKGVNESFSRDVQTGIRADGTPAIQTVKVKYIPEGDLYRLIIRSKLPNAEKFERWVFDEVLPTIRKTGGYVAEDREEEFINIYFPAFSEEVKLAMVQDLRKQNKVMKTQLKEEQQKCQKAEQQVVIKETENKLLAKEIVSWNGKERELINALVRAYANQVHYGQAKFAYAWTAYKKELLYKCKINLDSRITKYLSRTKKKTKPPVLSMVKDSELGGAVSVAIAMCEDNGVRMDDLVSRYSEVG